MGIVTTYVCDHCQRSLHKPDEFHRVKIVRESLQYKASAAVIQAMWCSPCLKKFNIYPYAPAIEKHCPAPPSLEDIIREIAGEAAQEAINDR